MGSRMLHTPGGSGGIRHLGPAGSVYPRPATKHAGKNQLTADWPKFLTDQTNAVLPAAISNRLQ